MNVENISGPGGHGPSSSHWTASPSIVPKIITKDYVIAMKDRITRAGGQVPDGLEKLITNFNLATHQEGKMTVEQFSAYAAANGVDLTNPVERPHRPPQTSGGHGPSGAQGPPASDFTSASSENYSPAVSASTVEIQTTTALHDPHVIQTQAEDPVRGPQPKPGVEKSPIPLDAYA